MKTGVLNIYTDEFGSIIPGEMAYASTQAAKVARSAVGVDFDRIRSLGLTYLMSVSITIPEPKKAIQPIERLSPGLEPIDL